MFFSLSRCIIATLLALTIILFPGLSNFANADQYSASPQTESTECKVVRLADPGWTDIAVTTNIAAQILRSLGYIPKITFMHLQLAYASLGNNKIDVFLGGWMPSQTHMLQPFLDNHLITDMGPNLENARYTLAVMDYTFDAGLRDFNDIINFKERLSGKIFGVEPGNDGNVQIQKMLQDNAYKLQGFQLVETSEQGMLSEVARWFNKKKDIIFLAWEPHPMNYKYKIRYLAGGDNYFGPNAGSASVHTLVPSNYEKRCPNVGRFLRNLKFDITMETSIINDITSNNIQPEKAVAAWLHSEHSLPFLEKWLSDVKDYGNNQEALLIVQKSFGLR